MQTEIRSQLLLEERVTRKLEATALTVADGSKRSPIPPGFPFCRRPEAKHALGGRSDAGIG